MKTYCRLVGIILIVVALLLGGHQLAAQSNASATGPSIHMTVTASPRHGENTAALDVRQEDVQVLQGRTPDQITQWVPAQAGQAGMELLILLDDSSRSTLSGQLDELRAFMSKQPPTTLVGVGYMHNGAVEIVHNFTSDHAAVGAALRMPLATQFSAASPYLSITDVLKRWPFDPARPRREILMMSDGIDPSGNGAENIYVNAAIQNVQRADVVVYAIYTPGADTSKIRAGLLNWGKTYLDMISSRSGGEVFYLGAGSAVSFGPYLDNLADILNHQYLLTFFAHPQKKDGYQKVKVSTELPKELPNVKLTAADEVYVPAASR